MPFEVYAKYLFAGGVGFVVAYLFTLPVARLARSVGMIDHPGGRRIHATATPRGGGIAVYLGFHAACATMFLLPWSTFSGTIGFYWWWRVLPVSTLMLCVGLMDDLYGLRPWYKLFGQIGVAVLAYAVGIRFGVLLGSELPLWGDLILTVFWLLVFMNAFNLIDGMDGLASGLAVIAAVGMAGALFMRRQAADVLILLGLAGACLGFLRFNFHPARVFLGDAGSMFIGFILGAVALNTGSKGTAVAMVGMPLLAAGIPIFDTLLAIWRRAVRSAARKGNGGSNGNGDGVFTADQDHLHHRLVRRGMSQRRTAVHLYGANALLVLVGLLSMGFRSYALAIYMIAFVLSVYVFAHQLAYVELRESGVALLDGLKRPPRKALFMLAYVAADLVGLTLAALVTLPLSGVEVPWSRLTDFWVDHAPVWTGVPFIFLVGARTYSRVWSRARVYEAGLLVVTLLAGCVVATVMDGVIRGVPGRIVLVQAVMMWLISSALLVFVRALPHITIDMLVNSRWRRSVDDQRIPVLAYCAGYECMAFFYAEAMHLLPGSARRVVVGVIDEDPNLHGRIVYGCRVLGGFNALEESLRSCHAQEIVVIGKLDPERYKRLLQVAESHQVVVRRWEMRMEAVGIPGPSAGKAAG